MERVMGTVRRFICLFASATSLALTGPQNVVERILIDITRTLYLIGDGG